MGHELSHITTTIIFIIFLEVEQLKRAPIAKRFEKYLVKQGDCHTDDTSVFSLKNAQVYFFKHHCFCWFCF